MSDEISGPMSDNEALRRLVFSADQVIDILIEDYDAVSGDTGFHGISDVSPRTRQPEENAVKTVVTSSGADAVNIKEDDHLVGRIPAGGGNWVSPTRGSGAIKCYCDTGGTAQVSIATYIRNP